MNGPTYFLLILSFSVTFYILLALLRVKVRIRISVRRAKSTFKE